jgi:hypothetical protein
MTIAIAIIGLLLFRVGMMTAVDSAGRVEIAAPELAGCGAAMFLAVIASWWL